MASTKKINTVVSDQNKAKTVDQIEQLLSQLKAKLGQYEKENNKSYPIEIKDKDSYDYVNPNHYKRDDGKQTWEVMVDEFGLEETAIFCKLNAFKYQDRMGKKPGENVEREQKKVQWYEDKALELYKQAESLSEQDKNTGNSFWKLGNG